ncbi:MAG: DDE-type integrase/transposase/recombinase [Peptococcaceae bacterium]
MPWKETCVMDQKIHMISNWLSGNYTITELSSIHSVSRKTLYKWIERYKKDCENGLKEVSSRPLSCSRATPSNIISDILILKNRHPTWGARKLLGWLKIHQSDKRWPVSSTTHEILKRHGLVHKRRKRHHTPPYTQPFLKVTQPNEVWCADYKGQFRLGCGSLCYPFTLTDSYSRYILGCWGLEHPAYEPTRYYFERAFREYGLPNAIRTDNGAPFASVGIGGLSKLSVWFIKLGIVPERIEKGHPEQNGRHERMHRTLKAEATKPPQYNMRGQQRIFNRFQYDFDNERPHQALGQKTPATVYRVSDREYPKRLPAIEYPDFYKVRHIHNGGSLKWKNKEIYLSSALAGEYIGLTEIDNGIWNIYFSFYPVCILDERTLTIRNL